MHVEVRCGGRVTLHAAGSQGVWVGHEEKLAVSGMGYPLHQGAIPRSDGAYYDQ